MNLAETSHPAGEVHRLSLVFIGLERKPDNEIDNRNDPMAGTEFNGPDYIISRMAPVQPGEDCIAPGLGPEMEFCVGTIVCYQGYGFIADELRPDLAWECTEIDLVPEAGKETFDLIPPGMDAIRAIGKGIG